MSHQKKKLFTKLTDMALNNRLNEIKDLNQPLDIDLYGNKCQETYCYSYNSTLLGLAAFEGNSFLVNALLEAGANPNIASFGYRQFYMPIHLTIYGTSLEYGSEISKQIPISERLEIVHALHKYGADLDWTGNGAYSWSPLHAAGHSSTCSSEVGTTLSNELLRFGATPRNYSGYIDLVTLPCEEAANKYNSNKGYKLPEHLHNITATILKSSTFQYSKETQKLWSINVKNHNGDIVNKSCDMVEVVSDRHTDLFDLSEVVYAGVLTAQDLLDF